MTPTVPLTYTLASTHTAWIFRTAALAHGVLAGLLAALALAAAAGLLSFDTVRGLLLINYGGPADSAAAIVVLFALLNVSLFLVLMVGVTAREIWLPPAVLIVLAGNAAALIGLGHTPGLLAVGLAGWGGFTVLRTARQYRINPVMLKELRGRMRGARAFTVLTVYLALMSAFTVLIYLVYRSTVGGASSAAGEIGRVLFAGVVGVELLLIIFIAPSFTAGAITGERERQTYDLLQTTLLGTPSFVFGKLESALGYILLLLLAGIPLQSLAFLFGGISEIEVLLAFIILAVTAVALGTMGIFASALFDRTLTASTRTYSAIALLMFIAPIGGGILVEVLRSVVIGAGTGAAAVEAVLVYIGAFLTSLNPAATALATQEVLLERQSLGFWSYTLATSGNTIPLASPWIPFTIFYLSLSAALVVATIRRSQPAES